MGRGEAVCRFIRTLTVELEIRDGGERGAAAEDWSLAVTLGREDVGAQVPAVVLGAGGDRQGQGRGSVTGPEDGGAQQCGHGALSLKRSTLNIFTGRKQRESKHPSNKCTVR